MFRWIKQRIKCMSGSHSWDWCRCDCCGASRDYQHKWDDCKCRLCGKIRDEGHYWGEDCQKCAWCGTTRTDAHDWTQNCERCCKCRTSRTATHAWSGCKCSKCSQLKPLGDQSHIWTGCRCSVCGQTRNEAHTWAGCMCSECRTTRNEGHTWQDGKCRKCGSKPIEQSTGMIVPVTGEYHCDLCDKTASRIQNGEGSVYEYVNRDTVALMRRASEAARAETRKSFSAGETFSDCPKHGRTTTWTLR